jgi:DNA-binding MarR family transcriptional regulator
VRNPAVVTWLRISRIIQAIERASTEHLRGWDISLAQFDVLARVGTAEGISQQELADSLLVTKGNVCQLLDRMEQSGLVIRRQHGRSNRLYLTEQGTRLFAEVVPAHEDLIAHQFSTLTSEERSDLLRLTRKLDHALTKLGSTARSIGSTRPLTKIN